MAYNGDTQKTVTGISEYGVFICVEVGLTLLRGDSQHTLDKCCYVTVGTQRTGTVHITSHRAHNSIAKSVKSFIMASFNLSFSKEVKKEWHGKDCNELAGH